ncbi:MAG: flagellar hook-basal body protein [Lachnospiraceae bacterium]
MMKALWSAASGMITQQTNVDTIANNISNVNTVAYKTEKAEFKSLLYQTIQAKTTSANGDNKPIGAQVGLGTRLASITSSFKPGNYVASESNTAFAIKGDGFFAIAGSDGQIHYTRNGNFSWGMGVDGVTLSTSEGNPVLDDMGNPIVLPNNVPAGDVQFTDGTGEMGYIDEAGVYVDLNMKPGTWQFNNPAGLDKEANGLFAVTQASGRPMNEATNPNLTPSSLKNKYLESSNVQVADEMVNLIVAQRAYEMNSKAIQAADDMLSQANNLKR